MAKNSGWNFLNAAAEAMELPADVVAGAPLIEIVGRGQLRMENHRGILAYGPEEISVSGGRQLVHIYGEKLELAAMDAGSLLVTGRICRVELE